MNLCRFSIVVPVYQAQDYLEECICSVLRQDYQSYELILVDDGSTDGSLEICNQYAKKYSQIKVIHKDNEGPLLTRCRGFLEARGEYILNLDADDFFEKNALSVIDSALLREDIDILIFNYRKINMLESKLKQKSNLPDQIFTPKEKPELLKLLWGQNAFNLVWNKVFRATDVRKLLPFPKEVEKVQSGEDVIVAVSLLLKAGKIKTIHNCVYNYRMAENSITHKFNLKKGEDFLLSRNYMMNKFKMMEMYTNEVMVEFYTSVYQTIGFLICDCARSDISKEDKIKFFQYINKQSLYKESLYYINKIKINKRKRFMMYLFENRKYRILILIEQFQMFLKKKSDPGA